MTFAVGEQVKIVAAAHPWTGAIGRLVEPWDTVGGDWVIELETILPGQQAAVYERELRRV